MAGEWEGNMPGQRLTLYYPLFYDFTTMTVDKLRKDAQEFVRPEVEPDWQMFPFHDDTLTQIVESRRQQEFLQKCKEMAEMPINEIVENKKCKVKHHAIRVTDDTIDIVEKEYYYGSCPGCYAAGPTGHICLNPHCNGCKGCDNPNCTDWWRFIPIYAREKENPGSAIHRSVIAGAPIKVLFEDKDRDDVGRYQADLETRQFNPMGFLVRSWNTESEIFGFDQECKVSNLATAIGCADDDVRDLLTLMYRKMEEEQQRRQARHDQDE